MIRYIWKCALVVSRQVKRRKEGRKGCPPTLADYKDLCRFMARRLGLGGLDMAE